VLWERKLASVRSIAIVDSMYPAFLRSVGMFERSDESEGTSYTSSLEALHRLRFGTSDVYSTHFKTLGWAACEIIANSSFLQAQWAEEQSRKFVTLPALLSPALIARVPPLRAMNYFLPTIQATLVKQIEALKPDVVYFQDLNLADPGLMGRIRRHTGLMAGQIASPLPPAHFIRSYDVIFSSLPNLQERIRSLGVKSDHLPIAFDARLLDEVNLSARDIPLSFVGGISRQHSSTIPMLQAAWEANDGLEIFGYGGTELKDYPELASRHRGERWGRQMYEVLARSEVTLNRHIDVAEQFANNMRLYEATGMGSLLITDHKVNLHEIFEVGSEVLAYSSLEELKDHIVWARENPLAAREIARRGQDRTIRDHSYRQCIETLSERLDFHLGAGGSTD
jgi:spore maturation protein CgeB